MSNMIKSSLWGFYLQGREDRLMKNEIDEGALVAQMLGQPEANLHESAHAAAISAATAAGLHDGRAKRAWIANNPVTDVDAGEAYAAYLSGRIDKLAHNTERGMFQHLMDEFEEGPEGAEPDADRAEISGSRGKR